MRNTELPARLLRLVAPCVVLVATGLIWLDADSAFAQAQHPFNVGISEGGGIPGSALARWILAQQIAFEQMMSAAVRAIRADTSALWTLAGIAFAYGVFHAAGPGHGKAVVASYMIANEQELKRGLAISFAAAALQGVVAISLVGVLAVVMNATAMRMKAAAGFIETASYLGVALLGLWLVWRKGRGLFAGPPAAHSHTDNSAQMHHNDHDHGHVHDEHCGHFHAPDPRTLGAGFSWSAAAGTVVAAGLRPCSGAILVLVFALAQGIFHAGVLATIAMSFGTALTTGALAALAVMGKKLAVRYAASSSGAIAARVVPILEFAAALFILLIGSLLFFGSLSLR